jgi:hypothetical protein
MNMPRIMYGGEEKWTRMQLEAILVRISSKG